MKKSIFVLLLIATVSAKVWHITPTGEGGAAGGTGWANADAVKLDTAFAYVAPGDTCYWKGDHTVEAMLIDTSAVQDGTSDNPIAWINVKSTTTNTGASVVYADWSTDTSDMGHITFVGNVFIYAGTCNRFEGGKFSGSGNYLIRTDAEGVIRNTVMNQLGSISSAYYAALMLTGGVFEGNTVRSGGRGILPGSNIRVAFNSFIGISHATDGQAIRANGTVVSIGNKFVNCTYGIYLNAQNNVTDVVSTYYGCDYAIFSTGSERSIYVANSLIDSSLVAGITWNTATKNNVFTAIHGGDARNSAMWVNVAAPGTIFGCRDTTQGNPLFVNPPDSLQLMTGSPAHSAKEPR